MMNIFTTRTMGCLVIFGGLAMITSAPNIGASAAPADELAAAFGGDCYYCGSITGQCAVYPCVKVTRPGDPQEGRYVKAEGEGRAEAECRTKQSPGKKECNEDTPLLCLTQYWCDDNACSVNCSSTTVKVPTNCTMSGNCSVES